MSNVTAGLGNTISTILSIGCGGIVYFAALFIVGGIDATDVKMLPKSDKLLPVMKKFKLIKE